MCMNDRQNASIHTATPYSNTKGKSSMENDIGSHVHLNAHVTVNLFIESDSLARPLLREQH